jgi:hypothetical protein
VRAFLLAIAASAALVVPSGSALPRGEVFTLVTDADGISAFAQDGDWIAWSNGFGPCGKGIRVRNLRRGTETRLSACWGSFDGGVEHLVLAGDRALWTVEWGSNENCIGGIVTASVRARRERLLSSWEMEYESCRSSWTSGDGRLLVANGAVWRIDSPTELKRLHGIAALAVGGDRIVARDGDAPGRLAVHDARGRPVARLAVVGRVRSAALSRTVAAVLVEKPSGMRIVLFNPVTGVRRGAFAVPRVTEPSSIAVAGDTVALARGREIQAYDAQTRRLRVVARTARAVYALSAEGRRLAWTDGTHVRALMLG